MNKLQLYYFSGTGNAKQVARWIDERAATLQLPSCTDDIASIERASVATPEKDLLVGIIGPTHGFNYPPILVNFIFRFPRSRHRNPVFVVNTRAGLKAGKLFLPGASGIALWLAALVLTLKGYRVVGMRSIDLPSNWISLHPGLRPKVVRSIVDRCQRINYRFADTILSGNRSYRAAYDTIQDMLLAPVSILYWFMGRFIIAKTFYASSACNRCYLCVATCPIKAIKLVRNDPFWTYRCESCMRCMNTCPQRAIQTGHGFIFAVIYLAYTTVIAWMYLLVGTYLPLNENSVLIGSLLFIGEWAIVYALLLIGYRILHRIKRINGFKQLIEYTSLTTFKFWRRYFLRSK